MGAVLEGMLDRPDPFPSTVSLGELVFRWKNDELGCYEPFWAEDIRMEIRCRTVLANQKSNTLLFVCSVGGTINRCLESLHSVGLRCT